MENFLLPTQSNNYTPKLLSRKFIIIYTLLLLIFNIITSDIQIFAASADVDVRSIYELHNQERKSSGLGTFTLNSKLSSSAKAKAAAMIKADCWDHYCPDGKSPWEFIEEAGYAYVYAGENLAEGFSDNQKVFDAWMNSQTHRENIMRPEFEEIGIAIEYGDFQGIPNNAVIVVHFGTSTTSSYQNQPSNTEVEQDNEFETQILSPKDGEILNTNTPTVEGTTGEDATILITTDNTQTDTADANEGIFTYKYPQKEALTEGGHQIGAENTINLESDSINITIDTIPPTLNNIGFDSISKTEDSEYIAMTLTGSDDILELSTDLESKITRTSEEVWTITVTSEIFDNNEKIEVTAYDHAGNSTTEELDLAEVKGVAMENSVLISDTGTDSFLGLDKVGMRRGVNILFLVSILTLLVIDYVALSKTDITSQVHRKQIHHHFSIFSLLLLISFAGGTAGELLNGTST